MDNLRSILQPSHECSHLCSRSHGNFFLTFATSIFRFRFCFKYRLLLVSIRFTSLYGRYTSSPTPTPTRTSAYSCLCLCAVVAGHQPTLAVILIVFVIKNTSLYRLMMLCIQIRLRLSPFFTNLSSDSLTTPFPFPFTDHAYVCIVRCKQK